ncbi:hypothetical protein [Bradyrhizobium sp. AZCC 2289]|uniref:hypothetical protein n=1 Tax=Bradyrhizobium sp. AZCC 2289 TaxID=3117026 RepID=UPI002FF35C70
MTKKFACLIVAAMGLAAPAYAQSVRVITGDIEHIYGPGGQILDDDALRALNERAERAKILRLREREDAMRQQELDAAAAATSYDEPYGAQDGSYYVGAFRSRHNRHVNLRRMNTVGAVSGNSLQFRHANARVRR